ncbi:MAG: hypothetical protein QOG67_1379 [Verrucomicrobiota bacterium]
MNAPTRFTIVVSCCALCAGGAISSSYRQSIGVGNTRTAGFTSLGTYEFASSDLQKFNFAQLEAIIRADAVQKAPRARLEFGSVKVEDGALVAQVLFFGPDPNMQAFLYILVPNKDSWKITRVQRLWFMPRSQLVRGLRV